MNHSSDRSVISGTFLVVLFSWRRVHVLLAVVLVALLFLSTSISCAHAAAGELDRTFGTNGFVVTDFSGLEDAANGVAVQSDGKIVVVGYSSLVRLPAVQPNADFLVARYNADGTLDTSFGGGGKVTTDFSGRLDIAQAVVIQHNGKIVVAGYTDNSAGTGFDFALARYNSDGSLDALFGIGGKVTTDFIFNRYNYSGNDFANDVALASDGRIIVVGYTQQNGDYFFALARYNSDGSLDTSFGADGKALTRQSAFENVANAVALQSDGKVIIAGYVYSNPGYDFATVRYNNDGSLDTSFGSNGVVTTDFAFLVSYDFAYDVAIQKDGKILVVGKTDNAVSGASYFALTRYETNGSLDTSFGVGGKVTTYLTYPSVAHSVAIQQDGEIVAAGWAGSSAEFFDFAVARFNTNGSLDSTFGSGGKVTTDLFGDTDFANAITIQPDGRIVLAGVSRRRSGFTLYPQNDFDVALARYEATIFDICIQDDSNGSILRINSTTGGYEFANCSGFILSGTGALIKRGGIIKLQHYASDRRVLATIDRGVNRATASIQLLSPRTTFTITDRNTADDTCACTAH
jgi:uncharacterized delta-60 repeat protein